MPAAGQAGERCCVTEVLIKVSVFLVIILMGYVLKRIGLFGRDDYRVVSKIIFRLTLPCAVINAFSEGFRKDSLLYLLVLLGLFCNLLLWGLSWLFSRGRGETVRAFYTQNIPGYNIGSFTMPFVQSFLGSFGVVAVCMFDMGNSVMCTGGNYALTSTLMGQAGEGRLKAFFRRLFSSVPIDTYIVLLILSFFGLTLPSPLLALSSQIGAANSFLSMLMVGMTIEISLDGARLKKAAFVLAMRYGAAALFASLFYFVAPFPLEIRQVLVLLSFAPIPSMSPYFTERLCGDASLSGFTSSISFVISIACISSFILLMGIGM